MVLERWGNFDWLTYVVIAAIMISILCLVFIYRCLYRSKTKKRFKIGIALGMLLLCGAFILYFYRPLFLDFQAPPSGDYSMLAYVTQGNSSGGKTTDRYELSPSQYDQLLDALESISLSRQLYDWSDLAVHSKKYQLQMVPLITEEGGTYLWKMSLSTYNESNCKSSVTTYRNGKSRMYKINNHLEVKSLLAILEDFGL